MNPWSKPHKDSQFASVDGLRLHYKRAGKGPVVLLIHGSGSSLQGVEQVALKLARSFTTIYLDLPGCGLTGARKDRDYRVEAYASVISRFMEVLRLPRYTVVGNSLGGNIAWNLALEQPERLDALVLINATGYPGKTLPTGIRLARNPLLRPLLRTWLPRSATEKNLKSVVGQTSTIVDWAMVDRVHSLMSLPGNRSAFVDLANTNQTDRSGDIHNIEVPTLVLRSAGVDGQYFSRDIKNSHEMIHSGGGHLLPEEDPEWVAVSIEEYLHSLAERAKQGNAS